MGLLLFVACAALGLEAEAGFPRGDRASGARTAGSAPVRTTPPLAAFVGGSRLPMVGKGSALRVAANQRKRNVAQGITMQRIGSIDFFKVLGVNPNTPDKEIKERYRKLAMEKHPDLSSEEDATEQFQLINQAYTMLSDPAIKRALIEGLARREGRAGPVSRKRASTFTRTRRYRVGDVVGHKEEKWIGVVVGIDQQCEACDEWIEENEVDLLPCGRLQKFFHILPSVQEGEKIGKEGGKSPPAFFMAMSCDDQKPTLCTAYLAEDQIYHFRFNTPEAGFTRESMLLEELGEVDLSAPIRNALVGDLFTTYSRGRYAYDSRLGEVSFTPVQNSLAYVERLERSESSSASGDDEEDVKQMQGGAGATVQPPIQPPVQPPTQAAAPPAVRNIQPPADYGMAGEAVKEMIRQREATLEQQAREREAAKAKELEVLYARAAAAEQAAQEAKRAIQEEEARRAA
eukprot:CAMPEP_0173383870 /NCGR_PEP_ID=MMETSP1356-20130122/6443_1 /TAXON_ID=77927 ORGANISM="Hemiselmis virescens, Strain PCC157" /NCGR_SAMPLE_ID=MMETSP1356 /ASSEMBLY_ACC=CAM_ASM_000847 /LENGTH=458 /DNA_ID=CAMNT_0014338941 /DNA_START=256 /DNA_END=1628 /DNA_ORIENTATION=+